MPFLREIFSQLSRFDKNRKKTLGKNGFPSLSRSEYCDQTSFFAASVMEFEDALCVSDEKTEGGSMFVAAVMNSQRI